MNLSEAEALIIANKTARISVQYYFFEDAQHHFLYMHITNRTNQITETEVLEELCCLQKYNDLGG